MRRDGRSRSEVDRAVVIIELEGDPGPAAGSERTRETALGAALLAVAIVTVVALMGRGADRPGDPERREQPAPADRLELSWDDLPGLLDGELQWDDLPAVLRGASQP